MTTTQSGSASPSPAAIAQSEFAARFGRPTSPWRLRIYMIIFESDTRAGRLFDLMLILTILASVLVVILDSVQSIASGHATLFNVLEWGFTLLFTVEYVLRLACIQRPWRYAQASSASWTCSPCCRLTSCSSCRRPVF